MFSFSLGCVCVQCTHVCFCVQVCVHAEVRGQHLMSSSITLYLSVNLVLTDLAGWGGPSPGCPLLSAAAHHQLT